MAVKVGKQSEEHIVPKYIGIAAMNVVAVNPTKEELAKILGIKDDSNMNEPVYLSKTDDTPEAKDVVRVVFWCHINPELRINHGADLYVPINFNITKVPFASGDGTKVQVIDKYGNTVWVTKEQYEEKAIPEYKNGPAHISPDYKVAYKGQATLIEFLAAWLNVQSVWKMNRTTKEWSMVSNPQDCEVCIEHMEALFKGDVKELATLVKAAPAYIVKAAIGVRTTDKGSIYQSVYNNCFLKNAVTNYSKIDSEIKASKARDAYADTEFSVEELHPYEVETKFSDTPEKENKDAWNEFMK